MITKQRSGGVELQALEQSSEKRALVWFWDLLVRFLVENADGRVTHV
jgi:hypothetical protein